MNTRLEEEKTNSPYTFRLTPCIVSLFFSSDGIFSIVPVTFYNFIRLCTVIRIMTVKEYNRSVEEFADSVYRFIRGNLKDEETGK